MFEMLGGRIGRDQLIMMSRVSKLLACRMSPLHDVYISALSSTIVLTSKLVADLS